MTVYYCSECHGPRHVSPSWGTWLEQKPGRCLSTVLRQKQLPKLYFYSRFFAFDIHSTFTKPSLASCQALKFLLLLFQVAWSGSTSPTTGSPPSGSFKQSWSSWSSSPLLPQTSATTTSSEADRPQPEQQPDRLGQPEHLPQELAAPHFEPRFKFYRGQLLQKMPWWEAANYWENLVLIHFLFRSLRLAVWTSWASLRNWSWAETDSPPCQKWWHQLGWNRNPHHHYQLFYWPSAILKANFTLVVIGDLLRYSSTWRACACSSWTRTDWSRSPASPSTGSTRSRCSSWRGTTSGVWQFVWR